jgi:hypothetical protein
VAGNRSKMVLMGGEKDGWEVEISEDDRPDVFYVVPAADDGRVGDCKTNKAKLEMRNKLAVLAYKFNKESSNPNRFKMDRAPELDRVAHTDL